jgi:hypothetical protein
LLADRGFSPSFRGELEEYICFGHGPNAYATEWHELDLSIEVKSHGLYVHIWISTEDGRATVYDYSPSTDNRYMVAKIVNAEFRRVDKFAKSQTCRSTNLIPVRLVYAGFPSLAWCMLKVC